MLTSQKIAVIGLACRLPDAPNATAFWQMVESGKTAITRLDRNTLLRAGLTEEEIADPAYVPAMAPLSDAESFDASFFGMSEQEALLTDPQHRLFLQTVWHALEDAGVDPHGGEARIGCYAGAGMSLYAGRRMASYANVNLLSDPSFVDGIVAPQITVANKPDYLATKTAYKFGLKGPALSIHTACSTGLVVVHLACSALQLEECEVAIAGAVALPAPSICGYRCDGGLLSPNGRCLPFDARANGTVGGAGVAVVILKPLSRAIADGDHVHAVILASAINNDGADKVSFLSPSVEGQIEVIRSALARGGIPPSSIGHVESHGTGTLHGDPIEFLSLTEAYEARNTRGHWRCALGAAKANIGHLDTAAGAAGLIKAILALERGIVPPIAGFADPNPELELNGNAFYFPRAAEPWPVRGDHPRRAAVNSFGAGGTNAHLILEQFVQTDRRSMTASGRENRVAALLLSAKSPEALQHLVHQASETLVTSGASWVEVTAASQRRHHFPERIAIVAQNSAEAATACRSFNLDAHSASVSPPTRSAALPIVFLFAGQGTLDVSVIQSFLERFDVFARTFDRLSDQLIMLAGFDLRRSLTSRESMSTATVAQPLHFAFSISLVELWLSVGIRPELVIGHSLGEIAAAVVAGVLDTEAGMRLVAARGRLMDQHCASGGMVAVGASRDACQLLLSEHGLEQALEISAINGPRSVVVSGDTAACERLIEVTRQRSIASDRMETTHGFHSQAMSAMLPEFAAIVAREAFGKARLPFIVTEADGGSYDDPTYWVDQVRQSVDFVSGANALLAVRPWVSIEIGGGATLTRLLERCVAETGKFLGLTSAVHGDQRGAAAFLHAAGALHCQGVAIDWHALESDTRRAMDALPPYPFHQQVYRHTPGARATQINGGSKQVCQLTAAAKQLPTFYGQVERNVILVDSRHAKPVETARSITFISTEDLLATGSAFGTEYIAQLVKSLERPLIVFNATRAPISIRASDWTYYLALQTVFAAAEKGVLSADICILTCGGVSADQLDSICLCPEQAAIWALAKTARCELSSMAIYSLDVDRADTDLLLLAMQTSERRELEVVIRQGLCFSPGWRREAPAPVDWACRTDASYMIIGGMSGLGLAVAEHLAARRPGVLILVGRGRSKDRNLHTRITAIEEHGVTVVQLFLDIADPAAMNTLANRIETLAMPLRGIIHSAGILTDSLIINQTKYLLEEAIRPKLAGLSNLVELALTLATPIDFLVAFSSISCAFGSPGQASYAAANAAMVVAAQSGRERGIPAAVVHWGAIEATGMMAEGRHTFERQRFLSLSPDLALSALDGVLADPWHSPVVIAGDGPWRDFGMHNDGVSLARSIWTGTSHGKDFAAPLSIHDAESLRRIVQDEVSRITGELSDHIALNVPFAELGIDSMNGMQLRNALGERLGLRLDPALIFRHPTIELLCRYLEVECSRLARLDGQLEYGPEVIAAAEALSRELKAVMMPVKR